MHPASTFTITFRAEQFGISQWDAISWWGCSKLCFWHPKYLKLSWMIAHKQRNNQVTDLSWVLNQQLVHFLLVFGYNFV